MDPKWAKEMEGKTTEECWDALYKRQLPKKPDGKSVWLPRGDILRHASNLIPNLPNYLKDLGVKTIADVGCSDAIWQMEMDWEGSGIHYIGLDIVEKLIDENKNKYPGVDFRYCNLITDECPKVDIVFIRNVLLHTSLGEIEIILKNIKASGSTFLAASTDTNLGINNETRKIWVVRRNLELEPFNFPRPIDYIAEMKYGEMAGRHNSNNFMGLWKVSDLKI